MKLMKTVLKYGAVFGAGALGALAAFSYGAVINHEEPCLPDDEVLILNNDGDKKYKVVAMTSVPKVGDASIATIERIE